MHNYEDIRFLELLYSKEFAERVRNLVMDEIQKEFHIDKESQQILTINKGILERYHFRGICKIDQLPAKANYLDVYCVTCADSDGPWNIEDSYGNTLSGGDCVCWTGIGWQLIPNHAENANNTKEYILTLYNFNSSPDNKVSCMLSNADLIEVLPIISNKNYPLCRLECKDGSFVYDTRFDRASKGI